MSKSRLEAFSDGVIAIILTIMVLELRPPHASEISALAGLVPHFLAYLLSFAFVGIYWNNHHHLLQTARKVNGAILWANLHLLFWLSLIPATTAWLGEHPAEPWPVALYGIDLLGAAIAYTILSVTLVRHHGQDSLLARALGADFKGKLSLAAYALAVAAAFLLPWVSCALYAAVAIVWLVPDRRIERLFVELDG
jgi:uncharacterized membrane protein